MMISLIYFQSFCCFFFVLRIKLLNERTRQMLALFFILCDGISKAASFDVRKSESFRIKNYDINLINLPLLFSPLSLARSTRDFVDSQKMIVVIWGEMI